MNYINIYKYIYLDKNYQNELFSEDAFGRATGLRQLILLCNIVTSYVTSYKKKRIAMRDVTRAKGR